MMKMVSQGMGTQLIGLILEIIGTFFFARSVFLSDEEIKRLSYREMGGFLSNIEEELKKERRNGRIGLTILLFGLSLQGIGLFL
jgi:hypothetical protein